MLCNSLFIHDSSSKLNKLLPVQVRLSGYLGCTKPACLIPSLKEISFHGALKVVNQSGQCWEPVLCTCVEHQTGTLYLRGVEHNCLANRLGNLAGAF